MKFQTRLVMGLLSLLLLVAGAALVGIFAEFVDVAGTGLEGLEGATETGIAGAFLLVVGIVFLLISFSRAPESKRGRSIVQFHENGELRIALVAVENMVLRISRQVKGIRETTTRVDYTDQGLLIYVKAKVLPDNQVPQLVSELQNKVKEYVEEMTGILVVEVKVLVENIVIDQITTRSK